MEFYAQPTIQGYQIPCILDNSDLLNKAKHHLSLSDYKATAVYTRSAFEKIIRNYCDKKRIKVTYHSQQKKYTSEDFWNAIKENSTLNLTEELITKVERYRDLVLNAFSHYNTEKHEIRSELTAAIETMRELKSALSLSR
jgi:ribulose kinase